MDGGRQRQARKGSQTQWAAQFLAAAELVRRGFVVSFTMGNNTPLADLIVGHPITGKEFWVDVKGLASRNAWLVAEKHELLNSFYILVFVGQSHEQDRFFIMSQAETNALVQRYKTKHPEQKPLGNTWGFNWGDPAEFENRWDQLIGM